MSRGLRCLGVVAVCLAAHAHDPITTRLTWSREVSRIVYARCASCHRPGGTAFSLLTYAEARPWARAISEEVLERRMPPWGAVKGFGEFRNEEALTQSEFDAIAQWVDGGAPEGDAKDLPAAPKTRQRASLATKRRVVIDGDYTLGKPIVLDGLVPEAIPAGVSAKIAAELPNGAVEPLVWLHQYDARHPHPFLLRTPLRLPRATVIRGIPPGMRIALLGH